MSVSNILKDLRAERAINQTQIAKLIGVSRQTIHAIETQKYTPSVELALKISKVLELKVEDVFKLEREDV